MTQKEQLLALLRKNLLPAFGCTDPVTPALAAAVAFQQAGGGQLLEIDMTVSCDIYKGAHDVVIPGTNLKGLACAAALGVICGRPDRGLMVLEDCGPAAAAQVEKLLQTAVFMIRPDSKKQEIYVELALKTHRGEARIIFDGQHDNWKFLEANGEILTAGAGSAATSASVHYPPDLPRDFSVLAPFAASLSESELDFIAAGVSMNRAAAETGMTGRYGQRTAAALQEALAWDAGRESLQVRLVAAAAGDARMGGAQVPLISVFGSGNQGALIFCSIDRLGELRNIPPLRRRQAIALACLTAGILNQIFIEGTPFCDCAMVASVAAAAGIVFLFSGTPAQMEAAARMTIGTLAGLLCDGAKPNCAQKIALGAGVALENALTVLSGEAAASPDGVLGLSWLDSAENIRRLGQAMRLPAEQGIVEILQEKDRQENRTAGS